MESDNCKIYTTEFCAGKTCPYYEFSIVFQCNIFGEIYFNFLYPHLAYFTVTATAQAVPITSTGKSGISM